jgi:hypothetical protein
MMLWKRSDGFIAPLNKGRRWRSGIWAPFLSWAGASHRIYNKHFSGTHASQ